MRSTLFRIVTALAVLVFISLAGSRLIAPGPPDFLIEPTTRMVLVAIEPGSFQMGSPQTEAGRSADEEQHRVNISRRFYMGRYEVTQAEWHTVMETSPSRFSGCARCPVEQVNFYDVAGFLARLTSMSTSIRFRLPTEAEWEYACRAGSSTPYGSGDRLPAQEANIIAAQPAPKISGEQSLRTRPVGSYPPNSWGLFDMHGNVWEWNNDIYGPYTQASAMDPRGPVTGPVRVIRGGGWDSDAGSARCAQRYTRDPQDRAFSLGFRVVGEPIIERKR